MAAGPATAFVGPDAAGYRGYGLDEPGGAPYNFVDISTTGTQIADGDDNVQTGVAIGFSFPYYGALHTTVCLATNGLLVFASGCTGGSDFTSTPMPGPDTPVNAIGVVWGDWCSTCNSPTSITGVYYQTVTGAFGTMFIAQWNVMPQFGSGNAGLKSTFQAQLFPNGAIVVQASDVECETNTAARNQIIGTEDATGTVGLTFHNRNVDGCLKVVKGDNYTVCFVPVDTTCPGAAAVPLPEMGTLMLSAAGVALVAIAAVGVRRRAQ